jgi:hypothetical protein
MYSTTPTATVADGTKGTPYTASQITAVVGNNVTIAIDVNTAMNGETLQLFEVLDTTTMTRLAHYTGPTVIGNITNNGNGFGDWSLTGLDLTGVAPTDGILFHAYWTNASDGGESFWLVDAPAAVPGPIVGAGLPGRVPSRPPAHWLLDHVDDVALLDEEIGPAFAAVRRAHPVGRRLRIAVDQHKRIGSPHILWRHHLDIGLATHDLLAGFSDIMAADVKEAACTYR